MRPPRASAHRPEAWLALVVAASGCGFVFQGTHQTVALTSEPPGARAALAGEQVTTPGRVRVRRQEWAIVRAEKEGYEPACRVVGAPRDLLLSLLDTLPVGLGWAVDKPSETLRRFPAEIHTVLRPLPEGAQAARLPTDWEIMRARRRGEDACAGSHVRRVPHATPAPSTGEGP